MGIQITQIEYYLPKHQRTNEALSEEFPEWSPEKIELKTGIKNRFISSSSEFTSDLAIAAAEKLFENGSCNRSEIDFLLLCTQTPDYLLPTTGCRVQDKLGLSTTCGALDVNMGCSGYIYGLSLAQGLILSGVAKKILLLTADTYSKLIHDTDHSNKTLFGDGATATLITETASNNSWPFLFGTDGSGLENLIVKNSAMHHTIEPPCLYMNGGEIFNFTLNRIPNLVSSMLQKANVAQKDIDRYVFHQANGFMLEHLRRKIGIEKDRFIVNLQDTGNTVSSTIPIALKKSINEGTISNKDLLMLVGFGVGYSWGATVLNINLEK